MTLTQLEYVVAVATYKSFIAAAEKCFVTQPTLSMQIHKLEEELNVKIFDRSKHPITATQIGEAIVEQAKVILAESDKIQDLVASKSGLISGHFRLAMIPTLAPYIIPKLLNSYSKKYPDLKLEVVEMRFPEIIRKLKNGELDAALVGKPGDDLKVIDYPMFKEPLVAYLGTDQKAALKKRLIKMKDIDLSKVWLLNEGNCFGEGAIELCSKKIKILQSGRPYNYNSANVETLRRLVDANGGATVIPELATFEFNEDLMERIRYFSGQEPYREVALITNEHFVRVSVLTSLKEEILNVIPHSMHSDDDSKKSIPIHAQAV